MRIIFAGTPDFAASHLHALLHDTDEAHKIVAVYTQPDRPAGRGKKLQASAVKALAIEHDLPVYQPQTLKTEQAVEDLQKLNADLMIVVAYGVILPKAILSTPKFGCINVHGSILPKWRGAAPIQRSIWAGDAITGVSIMQMDEGLDTGPVLMTQSINIEDTDTSASLYSKLAKLGPKALLKSLANFSTLTPIKQNDQLASYAKKLSKEEARIDFTQTAKQLARNVRAFNPWPVAWFMYNDKPVKIWQGSYKEISNDTLLNHQPGQIISYDKTGLTVACGEGVLTITKLQLAGKKAQDIATLVNGQNTLFIKDDVLA